MSSIGTAAESSIGGARSRAPRQNAPTADAVGLYGVLIDWRAAQGVIAPWRALAGAPAEENPFYEPWTLLPALRRYAGDRVRLACIWDGAERKTLLGLAPVEARCGYARLAIDHWAVWTHPHCYFAAPLMRRGHERQVAGALLKLLCGGHDGRSFFRLEKIDRDGAIVRAFYDAAAAGGGYCYIADACARAALFAGPAPDAYFERCLRKKKRKELNRLRNRLQERGPVAVRRLTDQTDLEAWTNAFLDLEDRSWKGARGTALKSSSADAAWFRESIRGAFGAGKLCFLALECGGRPIAMLVNFANGGAGYSIKIAHDPGFARFSPGVMIEIEATKRLLADPEFQFMDSCAAPDHPMIDSLWKGRRRVASVNISGAGAASKTALRLCHALERARGALEKARPGREKGRAP